MASGPRRTRLEYDERRRQILAAARRLFAERDYPSVSMREIAEAAGVARGLLNHYFGSKRELYLEVIRETVQAPAVPPVATDEGSRDEMWARSVDGWLDLMEANRESWLTMVRMGESGHDPEMRHILDAASEVVVERVLEALGLDSTAPPVLRAVVRAYGGMAQEATREWLERGRLTRQQVRVLLVGAMPLIARDLVPDVIAAAPRRGGGRRVRSGLAKAR